MPFRKIDAFNTSGTPQVSKNEVAGTSADGCATHALPTAALFRPTVPHRFLEAFRDSRVEISAVDRLDKETKLAAALIFGGDGTIHRHLRPLIENKIPLLPVPVGSGNDFAHALGINSVQDAVSAWTQFCSAASNVREIDVGVIRSTGVATSPPATGNSKPETYFCNVAGVGLDSEANRLANAMPRWVRSHGGYILSALKAILTFPPTVVTITAESESSPRISEHAMLVAVANTPAYGNGMRIAPRAQLADGLLDVCFVRRTGRLRLLRNFPRVFRGEHLGMPEVKYFQASRLRIESERPMDLYADGEPVCGTPLEIEVVPRALRVIVPAA